ncbi:MAG: hypothetical protein ACLP1Q_15645 [Solirubrobacteraceae bacterium]
MSVSFGLFRLAVRDLSYRPKPPGQSSAPVTPIMTFRKAICTYHDEGQQAALDGISLTSDYWTTNPRGKTLADNYYTSFGRYVALDALDPRQTYDTGVRCDLKIAGEVLKLYVDALVYDTQGHTARIALWDVPLPSEQQASVMAAPVAQMLLDAVGEERARSVALWHLRSGRVLEVDVGVALGHIAEAAAAVRRVSG